MGIKKKNSLSAFTILILIIISVAILTWFIKPGEYQKDKDGNVIAGSYKVLDENHKQGIWDVFLAPVKGFKEGLDISLFILVIGGFLGIVMKTKALEAFVSNLAKKMKGKEELLVVFLIIFFSISGTTYGMAEETIPFYFILFPILLKSNFDQILVLCVILLGAGGGVLASTINPFSVGVASSIVGISISEGLLSRIILLIVIDISIIIFTLLYMKKIKKNIKNSISYDTYEEVKKEYLKESQEELIFTKKRKLIFNLFVLTFVIMIISIIPWDYAFSISIFSNITNNIKNIPFLGDLIGQNALAWGDWYFVETTMLFLVSAVILGIIYGFNEEEIVDSFIKGASDLLSVAMIIGVSRGIGVVMDDGHITASILHFGETNLIGISKSLFSIAVFIFYLPLSFLIPSTSGLAGASMSIMGPLGELAGVGATKIVTAFQSAEGIINLITPTSAVVMGALSITKVSLGKWIKFVSPLLLVFFIIVCFILMIF